MDRWPTLGKFLGPPNFWKRQERSTLIFISKISILDYTVHKTGDAFFNGNNNESITQWGIQCHRLLVPFQMCRCFHIKITCKSSRMYSPISNLHRPKCSIVLQHQTTVNKITNMGLVITTVTYVCFSFPNCMT